MSTSYSIYRFAKPKKGELKEIEYFTPYDGYEVKDADGESTGEIIYLYKWDSEYTGNIRESRFSLELTLPEKETDYERFYRYLGFSEDAIKANRVHVSYGTGYHFEYSDGEMKASASYEDIEKFKIIVQTHCFAVKMKKIWDSDEVYSYPDHDRVLKYLPDIDDLRYVPVNNQILAKAEIPFLIFEKNKGRCFIEKS